jgi:hypothetical protein
LKKIQSFAQDTAAKGESECDTAVLIAPVKRSLTSFTCQFAVNLAGYALFRLSFSGI